MCRWYSRIFCLLVILATVAACRPRALPAGPDAAVPLKPGRYVKQFYIASDFEPTRTTYTFSTFPVIQADKASAQAFQRLFQEELLRAWQDQGLKAASGREAAAVSGTIHRVAVKGARLRWLSGRLHASLALSGTITRGSQVLFAFQDQVAMSSPITPGRAAPQEKDLLLRRLAREAVHHLLNEMLLHGVTTESG